MLGLCFNISEIQEQLHFTVQSAVTSISSALLLKEIKQEAAREYVSTTIKTGNPLLEASQSESSLPHCLLRV